ncbi:MAG: penicillin-binding transpeptidase domain-containing protein, partial [Aestuariivirga sp.]
GYATFAQGGKLAHPYAVLEIHKPNGELLYTRASNEKEAPQVDPYDKVAELNSMMHDVVMQGTATRAQLGYAPVAGKTGTNANFRDAWFLGFSAHNVTGVWVGNDDNSSMASSRGNAVTGGRVPAPAWKRIMDVAEFGLKPEALPGVPFDATYTPPLTALNDPALGNVVSAAAPAAPQPAVDEEAGAGVAAAEVDQADSQSKDALNSMIDLFQNTSANDNPSTTSTAHPVPRRPVVIHRQASAPRQRSLLDFIFGRRGNVQP